MATIYVDPSKASNGNGSLATPYNTWASVTWVAGNTYLQAGGTTYSGVILVTVTGTQANPIIVGSYDPVTGLRTTGGVKRARVNGNNTKLTVRASGAVHWVTFDNLEVFGTTGTAGNQGIAIYLGSDQSSVSDDCTVSNCWIHDVTGLLLPNTDSDGIMFFGSRCRIINNLIENISADGVWGQGNSAYIVGNTIRRTSMENTRGDCVQVYGTATLGCANTYIAYNDLDHSHKESKQCIISGDVTGIAYSAGSVIEFNTCRMAPYAGAIQTTCILSYGDGAAIRNNVCTGGYNGIYFDGTNCSATGNIVDGNTLGVQQAPTAVGGLVAHNVCLDSTSTGIYANADATFRAYNNVLVNCATGIGLAGTENGNAFWLCTTNTSNQGGTATHGSRTVTTDPLFADPTQPWLGLKPGSPCQSAGAYIQGARDRFGRRYLNPPNIGPWAVIGR